MGTINDPGGDSNMVVGTPLRHQRPSRQQARAVQDPESLPLIRGVDSLGASDATQAAAQGRHPKPPVPELRTYM